MTSPFTSSIFLCQHIFSVLSLPINTFLIFLILTKSPPQLGAYKYLMIFISLFEISQSLLEVALQPLIMTCGSSFVCLHPSKSSLFSPEVLEILNVIHWGYYGSSLAVFAVHFVYRYAAMNKKTLVDSSSKIKIVLWFLPTIFAFFVCFWFAFFAARSEEVFTEHIRLSVFETFGFLPNEFGYLGMYIYEVSPENGSFSIHWKYSICSMVFGMTIFISFSIMVYFGWKCYHTLSTLISCSTASRCYSKLQSQLFYSLVIQTSIPLTFLIFPGTICVFLTVFNSQYTFMNGILSISIAFYPVIDPLPTIFIVKSYRNAVFELLPFCKRFENRIYASSVTSKGPVTLGLPENQSTRLNF